MWLIAPLLAVFLQTSESELAKHYLRGVALEQAEQWSQAEGEYRKAIELNPRHGPSLNNLGSVLLRQGRNADAAQCFERAAAELPAAWQIRKNLGLVYLQTGKFDLAVVHLKGYLAHAPPDAHADYLTGAAYMGLRDFPNAIAHLERARKELSGDAGVLYVLAAAYANSGKSSQAEKLLEQLFQTEKPELRLLIGEALEGTGPYDEALRELNKALDEKPDLRLAHFFKGRILWRLGQAEEAERVFRRTETELPPRAFLLLSRGRSRAPGSSTGGHRRLQRGTTDRLRARACLSSSGPRLCQIGGRGEGGHLAEKGHCKGFERTPGVFFAGAPPDVPGGKGRRLTSLGDKPAPAQ